MSFVVRRIKRSFYTKAYPVLDSYTAACENRLYLLSLRKTFLATLQKTELYDMDFFTPIRKNEVSKPLRTNTLQNTYLAMRKKYKVRSTYYLTSFSVLVLLSASPIPAHIYPVPPLVLSSSHGSLACFSFL